MKAQGLGEIQAAAVRQYEATKARLRQRYKLARDLGFSPKEAKALSGWSQERIVELARGLPHVPAARSV